MKTIFRKVIDDKEKSLVLENMVQSSVMVKKSDPNSTESFLLKCITAREDALAFEGSAADLEILEQIEKAVGLYQVSTEKYFFIAPIEVENNKLKIKKSVELYHLQRRDDFRVHTAATLAGKIEIQKDPSDYKLVDLSAGGCCIEIEKSQFKYKVGEAIQGDISIRGYDPIPFEGKIHHTAEAGLNKANIQFGVEFINMDEKMKNKLSGLVMEIYRQIFLSRRQ